MAVIASLATITTGADDYQFLQAKGRWLEVGSAPKFEVNKYQTGVASCYNSYYYYYKSWSCADSTACENEQDNCPKTDPLDTSAEELKAEIIRYVTIIVPAVGGGCILLCCLIACCAAYYATQYGLEWREK